MSNPDYTLAWPGQWRTVHIPARLWIPMSSGTPDPNAPQLIQNYTGGVGTYMGESMQFDHPTGVNPDPQSADYDLLLPPWIKHQRDGAIIDYAVSMRYWSTGGLGGGSGNVLFRFTMARYAHGTAIGSVAPVVLDRLLTSPGGLQVGIMTIQGGWAGAAPIPEEYALHLQIQRIFTNGVNQDTYLFEWFLDSVSFHYRTW